MKILEILAKPREIPMHLIAHAPGKMRTFKGRHDFDAAIMACPDRLTKKSGRPEPKIYWFNRKGQKKAIWDRLDQTGVFYGE